MRKAEMSYKLEKQESLPKTVQRVAIEEIDASLESMKTMNVHEAVHDVRKRLKKLRALARLVRDEMGEKDYKEINIYFRDLGRDLSPIRDLTAHIETIEALRARYGDHLYALFFNTVIKEIEKERDEMEAKLKEQEFFSKYVVEKLQKAQKSVKKWPVKSKDLQVGLPGVERVYKRGYKAMHRSAESPEDKIYHEWRKRVKYLWYHYRLLEDLWPGLFSTLQSEVHDLADLLGNDHDLVVLNEKLKSGDLELKENKQKEVLEALSQEYSDDLRQRSQALGQLIFAEKPKVFTERIGKYIEMNWD